MSSTVIDSPLGKLLVRSNGSAITEVSFGAKSSKENGDMVTASFSKELNEYFHGKRREFSVKFEPTGTEFQKKVWDAMQKIEQGKTLRYADVAKQIGHPKAVRAVGTACGKNPIVVAIPCHRIVGSAGLGGYSGGLDKKKWLLEHERK